MARCNSGEERCLPLINDSIANYNDSIFDYNDSSDIRHHSYSYNQNEAIQDTDRLLLEEDYQNLYDSFEKENGCQLFPNPAKNGFFIKVKNNAFCRVDVFEINGSPIKHFDGQKELLFFDMSGVAQGVYIVRIIIKDTVFYHKIIVE